MSVNKHYLERKMPNRVLDPEWRSKHTDKDTSHMQRLQNHLLGWSYWHKLQRHSSVWTNIPQCIKEHKI